MLKNNNHNYEDVYKRSYLYLLGKIEASSKGKGLDANKVIKQYLEPKLKSQLNQIFKQYLLSALNTRNRNIIINSIGGFENLGGVVFGFDPKKTLAFYGDDAEKVVNAINPSGIFNRCPNSLMYRYSRTIIDVSKFLSKFESANEFHHYCSLFYEREELRSALPLIIKEQIFGLGLALSSDALKEIGYVKFSKPDTIIRKVLTGIGYCTNAASDFEIQQKFDSLAKLNSVSPYAMDKVWWLTCAKYTMYHHASLKRGVAVPSATKKFIAYLN
jgi:hypothetical protein